MMLMPEPSKSRSSSRARSSAARGRAAGPALKFIARLIGGESSASDARRPRARVWRCYASAVLPFEIPEGTTLDSLIGDVVPQAHARLVPAHAGREPFTCALEIDGAGSWVVD